MGRGIFLIQNDGKLLEMREQAYESEDLLQRFLAEYPSLLSGEQIDPAQPRRWLLIRREAGIASEAGGGDRWSVDHLFLDQDGIPTLVEVKRSSDTRIRREVVGQMLDYAANAVLHWPVETIRSMFEGRCQKLGSDADEELAGFIGPDSEPERFWQQVKTNLQAGKIRLIFVSDEIPAELRRIVEFLNEQMDPAEVLAVEIKRYSGEGLNTLVPTVVGQTAESQQRKGGDAGPKRQWDEPSFFLKLQAERPAIEVAVARAILEWAVSHMTRIWWGKGVHTGSFVPVVRHNAIDYQAFAVYASGYVEIYFQFFRAKEPFTSEEKRKELVSRLNRIPGVSIPEDAIARRPSIRLANLTPPDNLAAFLGAFEWFVDQVKAL